MGSIVKYGLPISRFVDGVDYLHSALDGGFDPGFKVIKGYDLVGDAYTGDNTPKPDSDPLDACGAGSGASGRGTHVSGIIADFDKATNFTGVAPEANLGCPCRHGNSGGQGIYTISQPSTAALAFSVATIQNGYYAVNGLTATGIKHKMGYYSPSNEILMKNDAVVANADKNSGNDAECCEASQASPTVNAGAVGVIIYNNGTGLIYPAVSGSVTIPVVSISNDDGKELAAAIKKAAVTLTFSESLRPYGNAGTVSNFSSVGSEAELNFKPDIAGIGGVVYSTLPRYLGAWSTMSGTSMAAPYVAGSIALYNHSEGKNKKQSVSFIHEQFQNYAAPAKVYNSSDIDTPIRQGTGLVQVYDAITRKSHITPAQISFNDTATTKYRIKTFTITNHGSKTISYELTNDIPTAISPYNFKVSGYTPLEPAINVKAATKLRFSTKTFKLSAGQSKKITVTVTSPKTSPRDQIFYGGYIHVVSKQQSSGKDIKIPYFGVVGSQKTLPIFDYGYPSIIDRKSKQYGPKDTFTFDRNSTFGKPIAVLCILTPTKVIKADLLDAKTKKAIGTFQTGLSYVDRNFLTKKQKYNKYPWDGTYVLAAIQNAIPVLVTQGIYLWHFSALKLFGEPKNKKDWETWTSGPIVVKN